jgi:CHRD domain
MAHIRRGAAGVNGPAIITLNMSESGVWTVPPASKLTADQLSAYRAGELYVNVHTATNKGGVRQSPWGGDVVAYRHDDAKLRTL